MADTADQGGPPGYACGSVAVAWIPLPAAPSRSQREVNTAHVRQRGPGERANAEL